MQRVKEHPIDNRQAHLDVACFPTLFPSGRFGEFHARALKLSLAEYVKSRLLNKDCRFRKDAQYIFFLLWQHEIKQLSAGIYNFSKVQKVQSLLVPSSQRCPSQMRRLKQIFLLYFNLCVAQSNTGFCAVQN